MNQHYEMLLILSAKLDEKKQAAAMGNISEPVTKAGGNISKKDVWGLRKLSYPIQKEQSGVYVQLEFDLDQSALPGLEKEWRLMTDMIRYLVLKKKVKTPEQLEQEKAVQEKIVEKKVATMAKEKEAAFQVARQEKIKEDKVKPKETSKISLEDLDKKLDEILKEEI